MNPLQPALEPAGPTAVGLDESWQTLAGPGDWWSGAERVAFAAEVRRARDCALCQERKRALSPFSVEGDHPPHATLSEAAVDATHRITTDPGRLSRQWAQAVMDSGLRAEELVEIAGIVGVVTIADTLAVGLGCAERALPDPLPGEPSRTQPPGLRISGGWVPMVDPALAEGDTRLVYEMVKGMAGFVFNVVRSLTASPVATRGFFGAFRPNYMTHGPVPAGGLTRPQVEVLASTTSALNDCFY